MELFSLFIRLLNTLRNEPTLPTETQAVIESIYQEALTKGPEGTV